MFKYLLIGAALLALAIPAMASAGTLIEGGPQQLDQIKLLGQVIQEAKTDRRPVHIVYVHGMRAEGPNASRYMRAELRRALGITGVEPDPVTMPLSAGPAPHFQYLGQEVWLDGEWESNQPYVDRYQIAKGDSRIIVDEVNWWPLLFPLKCRYLLVPEHLLSGDDRRHVELCGRSDPPYHNWLRAEDQEELKKRRTSGGGAWPNGMIKRQIMNWGLADAVIALGPMRGPLATAMNSAFEKVDDQVTAGAHRVIVTESLGSFVVLDAIANGPAYQTRQFVEKTTDFYFFANQFALLELARLQRPAPEATAGETLPVAESASQPGGLASPLAVLTRDDDQLIANREGTAPAKQIVAFSDPSDMLSWRVPPLPGAAVVNVYTPATGGPLHLFADPLKAHRGHITSKTVWKRLLRGLQPQ